MSDTKSSSLARSSTLAAGTLGAGVLLAGVSLGSIGCEDALKNVKAPDALLDRVDLLEAPSASKLARYACHEWVGNSSVCEATLGSKPKKSNMRFSFDVVFDLNLRIRAVAEAHRLPVLDAWQMLMARPDRAARGAKKEPTAAREIMRRLIE